MPSSTGLRALMGSQQQLLSLLRRRRLLLSSCEARTFVGAGSVFSSSSSSLLPIRNHRHRCVTAAHCSEQPPRRKGFPHPTKRSHSGRLSPFHHRSRHGLPRGPNQELLPLLLWQRRCFANDEIATTTATAVDYFEIFGLPRTFGIDPKALKQSYLKLMTEHHPDKQQQQQQQQEPRNTDRPPITAETITHAYQTLGSPHTRALHWLDLYGCPLVEERPGSSSGDGGTGGNDDDSSSMELVGMEFLVDIMEFREAIEDARSDQTALEAISSTTTVLHEKCIASLEDLPVDGSDANAVDEATLQDARRLAAQLQYWHRLERTLHDAKEVG